MRTDTRTKVLDAMKPGPVSAQTLASMLDVPQASARRIVGELRREGWQVSTGTYGYRLEGNNNGAQQASV